MSTDSDLGAGRSVVGRFGRNAAKAPSNSPQNRSTEPPRQRRPALAALAVFLIVGGALAAGLLAIRLDSREPVYAAARDIAPGTLITAEDLKPVNVASEGLELISTDFADTILNGATYAQLPIQANTLVDQNMLTRDSPVSDGRAIVAVPLNPSLTPVSELADGDVVEVVRIATAAGDEAVVITEALVLSVAINASDELGGSTQSGSVNLLLPNEFASAVVDAAGSSVAGLALIARGQPIDVELQGGS